MLRLRLCAEAKISPESRALRLEMAGAPKHPKEVVHLLM